MQTAIPRNLVIVGDHSCGKTCLLACFARREYPELFIPTIYENRSTDIGVDDKVIEFELRDTSRYEDYDRVRSLSYPKSHVILICFSIDMPDSLDDIKDYWAPEILHFCSKPPVPYFLIGCKKDLRSGPRALEQSKKTGQPMVSLEDGERVAKKIGAKMYLECSAKTGEGVMKVFEEAARESLYTPDIYKKPRSCIVV